MAKKAAPEEQQRYTSFEKARLIGARALQISMGAPFAIDVSETKLKELKYNPIEIAKLEFEQGKIPIDIKRRMPE